MSKWILVAVMMTVVTVIGAVMKEKTTVAGIMDNQTNWEVYYGTNN